MFNVSRGGDGHLRLHGRLDASQTELIRKILDEVTKSCTLDFAELDYISSAGLGVLLATQKRLNESGHNLTISHMNRHIRELFHIAGFDLVFEID